MAHILRGTTTSMTTARTTYKPRGKIDHNSTRPRKLTTKMDMPMILKSEDLALHNNQTCEMRHSVSTRDVASMSNMPRILTWDESEIYVNILDMDIVDYSISSIETQGILRYINIPPSVTLDKELLRPDTYCTVLGRSDEGSTGCATIQRHQIGLTMNALTACKY